MRSKVLDPIWIEFYENRIEWTLLFQGGKLGEFKRHGNFHKIDESDYPNIVLGCSGDYKVTIIRSVYEDESIITNIKTFNEDQFDRLLELFDLGEITCEGNLGLNMSKIRFVSIHDINELIHLDL